MKDWIITIGIDKFYLTTEEKEAYLKGLSQGAKYISLTSGKILGANFQSLVPASTRDETEKLEAGKWVCNFGKWHSKNASCLCNQEYEFINGKAVPMLKSNTEVVKNV